MTLAWCDKSASVRADLFARIDTIEAHVDRLRPGELAYELAAVHRIAARHGIGSAITVIHALDSALSRGECGPLVRSWLAILRDAVGCTTVTPSAAETFAAACAVRLND